MIEKIAFLYKKNSLLNRTLIDSVIERLDEKYDVDVYNLINDLGIYSINTLDKLFQSRNEYKCIFIVDLGELKDYRLHRDYYKCPIVLLAGDDPQNFDIKKTFITRIKNFLAFNLLSINENLFYGNSACSRQYDIVFTHDLLSVNKYKAIGNKKVFWFPYWFDTGSLKAITTSKTSDIDLVTVMSPSRQRNKILNFLGGNKFFSFKNGVGNYGAEAFKFYLRGKIVFNKSAYKEINIRIFEALGLGCFLLTDKLSSSTGIYDLIKPNEHFMMYTSKYDLVKKIKFYLHNSKAREDIAKKGQELVLKNHTDINRAKMLEIEAINFNKNRSKPVVSIAIISWNRPWLLEMTLLSLKKSLRNSNISYEIILLDQNSEYKTKQVIKKYAHLIDKLICLDKNIGISNAFTMMYKLSQAEYFIHLENDWFCNALNDNWLLSSLDIMNSNKDLAFIKLRKMNDGQYGNGSIYHEPWTVTPFPHEIVDKIVYKNSFYYVAGSKNNCFTYNPTLMRLNFINKYLITQLDNPENITPLRSGEDAASKIWSAQDEWKGGTLIDGPFIHIGHNSIRPHIPKTIWLFLKNKFI